MDPSPEDTTVEGQLHSLRATVAALASALSAQSARLAALEQRAATAPPATTAAAVTAPPAVAPRPAPPDAGSVAPAVTAPPAAAPAPRPTLRPEAPPVGPAASVTVPQAGPEAAAGPPPRPGIFDAMLADWNWEWLVGGNWLARIGIVALIIGVGFFLKLAIDNDWIGETGQVALGGAFGLSLLAAGEFWRRRYPIWAQTLTGGGIAILYLSIFAAFSIYALIPSLTALGLFFLVTAAAAGLALRYESVAVAVLGIIGGFATPVLLWEKLPDQRALLAYVLVLDLGVLALATFRNWRWFTLLALLGSLGLFGLWLERLEPSLFLAQVGNTAIFLIFVGATTLFHILWKRAAQPVDFSLMMLNAAGYFGISYYLMFDELRPWMGGFTLLLAAFYVLLAYGTFLRSRQVTHLTLFAVGIALVFATIAVPVQLGGSWISVAWAAEATVVTGLSFFLGMRQLRWAGLAIYGAFLVRLFGFETPEALLSDHYPFWNVYALGYAISIALTYLTAYLLYRHRDSLLPWERYLFPGFLSAGGLILIVAVPTQVEGVWPPIAWAVEGAALVWLSFLLRIHQLRWSGLAAFLPFAVWLLAWDTPRAFMADDYPFWNLHALAYGISVALTCFTAYLLYRYRASLEAWEQYLFPLFLLVGTLIFTVAVPTQVEGVWLPIAWSVEVVALCALSFYLGLSQLRLFALGVFSLAVLLLLFVETFSVDLDTFRPVVNLRFLSFAVGIGSAYLSAILWWLKRDLYIDDREIHLVTAFLAVANVLTLWLLSAEVIASVSSSFFDVPEGAADNVISLTLSILWAIYAALLIIVGIARSSRWIRLAGLGLLAVPIVKLFAYDVFSLEREFRVAAFLGLGVILVVGGFLYQRYSRAIRGFILE